MMIADDLFAGAGGWDLAAEALGIRNGDTIGPRLWRLVVADMAGRRAA